MDWSRFKNYGLWVSIFAFIPLFLQAMGIEVIPEYPKLVDAFLAILVAMGLINNPTTKNKWYGDDDKTSIEMKNKGALTNSTNVVINNNNDNSDKSTGK
ncbi:hypothetical protein AN639_02670 [Candidatus Epulonipiscium fishelsonii]|uniref:Uncharacterized protein n=1 Tax=Candidatus Epulonipiscium fishelsonii TaxID=77094 RepID=A0ACC8XFL9_9FIRM|nr:hypothetical protein AN639_02670 [Epulopiscium sp. SCG-B05WGA-EpuloA1]ONI42353.1 hypothetical protein AN396_01835 [Epulopiscium sp. SCG-B11WGA-EpuloA1]